MVWAATASERCPASPRPSPPHPRLAADAAVFEECLPRLTALRSVHNALDPAGNGWVPRVDPARDCGATADNPRFGWGCFAEGRVPIVVLASDSTWYDGCDDESPVSGGRGHRCAELVEHAGRRRDLRAAVVGERRRRAAPSHRTCPR